MALKDVKDYYYVMLSQYIETKEDLADFEVALKDGYITEDKLEAVKEDIAKMKENLDRIQYIMYLFELPQRKQKQSKFKNNNQKLENYFTENNANLQAIKDENTSVLTHLRAELKKFNKMDN